jgi:hypothetical protein
MKDKILPIFGILYFVIGIIQCKALYDYFVYYLDWSEIIAIPACIFAGYIPFIGSIVSVIGAVEVWHWDVLTACAMFLSFPVLILVCGIFCGGIVFITALFHDKRK